MVNFYFEGENSWLCSAQPYSSRARALFESSWYGQAELDTTLNNKRSQKQSAAGLGGRRRPIPVSTPNSVTAKPKAKLSQYSGVVFPSQPAEPMENSSPSSSSSPPPYSPPLPNSNSGASKFLSNLPSRGFLSSTVLSSNPGGMRVYICEHETVPPEDQLIHTNQTNILIRSLQLKKQKGESGPKDANGSNAAEGSRKRASEKVMDGRASAKRSNSQSGPQLEGSGSRISDKDLYSLTVERLRALLKERGLSQKGKKDELVARLRSANG